MSTVDFWADRVDRPHERLALSNGLTGPATTAFQRLRALVEDQAIDGDISAATATARISGAVLRQLLAGLGTAGANEMFVTRSGHTEEASMQAAIDDAGVYSVCAVES